MNVHEKKLEEATQLAEMISTLSPSTKEKLLYMIEGAALVTAAQDKDAS